MIRIKIRFLFFRNGISFKTVSDEMSAVTEEMNAPWNDTTLPTLLSNYKLENVFNTDEFGLFYQCLPTKMYHLSREKCSGVNRHGSCMCNWGKVTHVCCWQTQNTTML